MKNYLALVLVFASVSSFANTIDCKKSGSSITMDKKKVTIEATNIVLTDDLVAMARQMTGSDESASLSVSMNISFPKKDLKCSTGLAKVFNCTGSTKKASVSISVAQQSIYGSSSTQNMRMPIKIENIDINSSVGSEGAIVLGSGPTTISLDGVKVKSSMFVKMNGDFQLEIEQNFKSSSECN